MYLSNNRLVKTNHPPNIVPRNVGGAPVVWLVTRCDAWFWMRFIEYKILLKMKNAPKVDCLCFPKNHVVDTNVVTWYIKNKKSSCTKQITKINRWGISYWGCIVSPNEMKFWTSTSMNPNIFFIMSLEIKIKLQSQCMSLNKKIYSWTWQLHCTSFQTNFTEKQSRNTYLTFVNVMTYTTCTRRDSMKFL